MPYPDLDLPLAVAPSDRAGDEFWREGGLGSDWTRAEAGARGRA
jgi:hypothetical protein